VDEDEGGEETPQKILVRSNRTAVEEVSTVGALTEFFP